MTAVVSFKFSMLPLSSTFALVAVSPFFTIDGAIEVGASTADVV